MNLEILDARWWCCSVLRVPTTFLYLFAKTSLQNMWSTVLLEVCFLPLLLFFPASPSSSSLSIFFYIFYKTLLDMGSTVLKQVSRSSSFFCSSFFTMWPFLLSPIEFPFRCSDHSIEDYQGADSPIRVCNYCYGLLHSPAGAGFPIESPGADG